MAPACALAWCRVRAAAPSRSSPRGWPKELRLADPAGEPVIGIDLGTTNSVVASVVGDRITVIPDAEQRRLHPSIVSFHPNGEVLVSYAAQQRRIVDARNTIFSAKRLIGQPFRSEDVQYAIQRLPYRVEEGPNEQTLITACGK